MTVQEEYFKNLSDILKKNFKKKGFAFNSFSNKEEAKKFVLSKIKKEGTQKYRLIAKFENSVYATVRFGE